MPRILLRSIKPKSINLAKYTKEVFGQLRQEGKEIEKLYKNSSSTWNPKPKFTTVFTRLGRVEAKIVVSTKDVRYVNLDRGTKKRWAVMSSPFSPKSRVRSLSASSGTGKAVIRGRRAMQARGIAPRPGIKPRKFSAEIVKRRRPIFFRNMRAAMKRAAKGTF